jgi:hypothetical protein
MHPAPAIKFKLYLAGYSAERKVSALCGATGFAPKIIALFRIVLPSVPFNPTAPPMPAIGFKMNPIVFVGVFSYALNASTQVSIKLAQDKKKNRKCKENGWVCDLKWFAAYVFLVDFV